ncbi:serine/threonine-protein kinase [Deinococcus sp. VB343]|uniref:Serine/threonine-protein kinase n=1 Tax=Deinococcus sp. VB142 TaxID=3112952 RepID=A0AAU6Q643_9DEIO
MAQPSSCPFCGSPVSPGDAACRVCGAALGRGGADALLTLPPGTTLQGGQYVLNRVLGQGGFGITYDAQDQRLGMRVAVKELFVSGSTRRGQTVVPPLGQDAALFEATKRGFLEEAKVLARFSDPGIVRVMNYFEENGTAYLVMEFLEGETLGEAIEKRGPLPPLIAAQVADSVAHTLEIVHGAGLLHRDIKPDNIFMQRSGRIVLIDFGSVRAFETGKTVSHTRLVTPGYAPLEQYSGAAKFGPYTDIYALGATLYHALTGQMPPAATDLSLGTSLPPLPPSTPPNLRHAVLRAMAPRIEQRPQDAQALRRILRGEGSEAAPAAPTPTPQPVPPPAPKRAPAPAPIPPVPTPPPTATRDVWSKLKELQRQVEAERQPAPARRAPAAPRPVPIPVPQPAPRTAPRTQPRRSSWPGRLLLILGGAVGGYFLGAYTFEQSPEVRELVSPEFMLVASVLGGGVLGALLWWAMPVVLPLLAASGTYVLSQNLGYRPPTVIAASVLAIVFSLVLMRLLRRI